MHRRGEKAGAPASREPGFHLHYLADSGGNFRPISVGGKHEFAKPGIDHFQQGFVFANGDPTPSNSTEGASGARLPYSSVGIELRPGKLRVKEDSRANYADIVEVDHDAQVMVVGDVVRYFDRVRRNVNKAFMRQILRRALEEYKASRRAAGETQTATDLDEPQFSASESTLPDTASVRGEGRREDKRRRRYSNSSTTSRRQRPSSQNSVRPLRDDQSHQQHDERDINYDVRSMHNVALAGLK